MLPNLVPCVYARIADIYRIVSAKTLEQGEVVKAPGQGDSIKFEPTPTGEKKGCC